MQECTATLYVYLVQTVESMLKFIRAGVRLQIGLRTGQSDETWMVGRTSDLFRTELDIEKCIISDESRTSFGQSSDSDTRTD